MDFVIVKSNIVNVTADAIVLPANEALREGPGTSRAIFEAAGRNQLERACAQIGHCDIGSAVPTPAFGLNARFIIHAVVPRWVDGNSNEYAFLSSAYLSSLKIADLMKCESIAFPLLASGNNGFNRELAFKIASESINSFDSTTLQKVILVVYGDNTENFVKSLGYDITVIGNQKVIANNNVNNDIILNGLKIAGEWLMNKENQKTLIEFGLIVASLVLKKDSKAIQALKSLKNLIK